MGILVGLTEREWELYPRHHGNGNELLGMGGNGNVENHSRTSLAVSTGVIYGHPYTYGPLSRVVCKRAARIEQSYDKTASTYSRMPVQLDRLHQSPAEPFSPQPWLRPSPPVIRPSLPDSTTAQRPRSDCMMIITVCLSVIHARCQLVVDSIERERETDRTRRLDENRPVARRRVHTPMLLRRVVRSAVAARPRVARRSRRRRFIDY